MKLALGTTFSVLCLSALVAAQTYTDCNPLKKSEPRFRNESVSLSYLEANSAYSLPRRHCPRKG